MRDGVAVEFSSPANLDLLHPAIAAASWTDRHFGKYYVAAFTAATTEKAWRASRFGWNAKIGRVKEIHTTSPGSDPQVFLQLAKAGAEDTRHELGAFLFLARLGFEL
jgi:hypothetical protein